MMLRAVTYCRCSTEEESQKDALSKQVKEAAECVRKNGWILVDEYIESRSGTTTVGRTEYNRLMEDMERDQFDIIVIKSQDRLMRNTKDWYLFVDRLVVRQKKLYIYIEQKFYTTDDALITGIKAILAEEYSRELSKKINNAHRHRQKTGASVLLTPNVYGFRKGADYEVELIEEEAEVKRKMYQLCASGFGTRTIETILKNDGVLKRSGKPFSANDILRIIKNPLNKGCVVMGRLHYDFDSKKTIRMPEEAQYVHEHRIPATVSDELWELANEAIRNRRRNKSEREETKGRNSGKYQLSEKLYCGLCGSPYYRRIRRRYKDNSFIYEWKCKTYLETGRNTGRLDRPQLRKVKLEHVEGCDNVHLEEEKLYQLLEQNCMQSYQIDKELITKKMVTVMKKVLREQNLQPEIEQKIQRKEKLKLQMQRLVDKLLDGVLSDQIYQEKQKELEQQLTLVQEQLTKLEQKKAQKNLLEDRIKQIEKSLREDNLIEKASVARMLDEIDKIKIYPTYMEVYLNVQKVLGVHGLSEVCEEKADYEIFKIEYGNMFDYKKEKSQEREAIVELIRENPDMTVKMMAEKLGISVVAARYRVKVLKSENRIRFNGAGGKGYWEIL